MTIAFWVIAANLIIIALLIVIVPIWFRRDINIDDNQQHNLEIGRQKLTELKNLRDNKILSESEYEEQLNELELALDDELDQVQQERQETRQGRWIVALIVPLLPISAVVIYLSIGSPEMIAMPNVPQHKQAMVKATTAAPQEQSMDISNMLAQLLERLKQNPEDSQGWFMLGRTYKYLKEYDKAVDAFAEANRLQDNNVDLMLQYADALIMSRKGRMDGKSSELVFKALSINPENTTGLWLAGMIKAEQGEFSAALEYWVKLEPLIENDAKSTIELQRLIVEARAKIGQQAPVVKSEQTQSLTTAPQAAATITPALTVRVQLSVDLQNQATSSDTVFIYAQALQGMRMPLAILRKQVKDLPITVTLTDAESMTPMAKLSGHEQVKILARISKAGSAMPQTGDLLGTVAPVQVAQTETIQLVISQVLD